MYRLIESAVDNQVIERLCSAYIADNVIKALGKEKFNLKGKYVVLSYDRGKGYNLIPIFNKENNPKADYSCLSKEVKEKADAGILKVGAVYRLHVKCRFIVSPDTHYKRCENPCGEIQRRYPICRVGKPAQDCWCNFAPKYGEWNYYNPECACWDFNETDEIDLNALKCNTGLTIKELSLIGSF